ncbi:MAG TPA: hypothetical protein VN743_12180 [Blastocatellia bacterium]|nr:hypothetical protein [Blastocatellia bacterium]
MNRARTTNLSLAAFVLLCFFLPWVELSCMGIRDTVSGYDLARSGDRLLWLLPLVMLTIIGLALSRRIVENLPGVVAVVMTVGGSISAYVMFHERSSTNSSPRLIATQWTLFFWLGFLACVAIVIGGFAFYAKRSRSP